MKKVVGILAVAAMTMGMFACETENTAETDALYSPQENAGDGAHNKTDERD